MQDTQSTEIEADIERLEKGIRLLKIQYDMFFAGAIPRQPLELRGQLERIIKRYSNAPIRKYAHRFHFNSLASRFNSLLELWAKTLQAQEEGDRPPSVLVERSATSEQILATCRIRDPILEQDILAVLHARFLDARSRAGDDNGKVSLDAFIKGIAAQAVRLREKSGCEQVELRLVLHERKVMLKARPGRE